MHRAAGHTGSTHLGGAGLLETRTGCADSIATLNSQNGDLPEGGMQITGIRPATSPSWINLRVVACGIGQGRRRAREAAGASLPARPTTGALLQPAASTMAIPTPTAESPPTMEASHTTSRASSSTLSHIGALPPLPSTAQPSGRPSVPRICQETCLEGTGRRSSSLTNSRRQVQPRHICTCRLEGPIDTYFPFYLLFFT